MIQNPPIVQITNRYKQLLFSQQSIAKMVKGNSFKNSRQLIPHAIIQKAVDKLELDKYSKKIRFVSFFKTIFYSVIVKNSSFSRNIASVGKRNEGFLFTGLPEVSHVSVIKRLHKYDEEKIDALLLQLCKGLSSGSGKYPGDKVFFLDGSTFSLSYSRTSDELPKIRSKGNKGLMKLGLVISANGIPVNWMFNTDHDDNQIFRDLVDWTKKGFTYIIDRGNVAVDFLQQFTDNYMFFIQKTWENHTFVMESLNKLPKVSKVLDRFDLLEEQNGWIVRAKDDIKVKVRRVIAKDTKTGEILSLTTNDFETTNEKIIQRHTRRWDIEVVFDWLKNTLGPNDNHSLTQWTNMQGLRNLIRIFLTFIALMTSYAIKKFGRKWRKPQRFSMGDVISAYRDQLCRWLEGKLGLRRRHWIIESGI